MTTVTEQTTLIESNQLSLKPGRITVGDIPAPDQPDIPLPPSSKPATEILGVDQATPDSHVPRDPRLLRLTGAHPFNSEPPLTPLFDEGMQ
jgi:nitrate reductase (NAD(P)H)